MVKKSLLKNVCCSVVSRSYQEPVIFWNKIIMNMSYLVKYTLRKCYRPMAMCHERTTIII